MNTLVRPYSAPDWPYLEPLVAAGIGKLGTNDREPRLAEINLSCERVREAIDPNGGAWIVVQQNHVRGFGCFRKLPWDSEQLQMPAARIDYLLAEGSYSEQRSIKEKLLEELLVETQDAGVWHLSVRVNAADLSGLHVLEEAGFITVDSILTFALELKDHATSKSNDNFKIRLATPDDAGRAATLARTAYVYDRFHADPFIDRQRADELHASWVSNSCLGKAADAVLIADDESGLLGYVTCKVANSKSGWSQEKTGTIVLVASAQNARCRGVAHALTMAALEWFRKQGCETVEVGTQSSNIPASRLYQKCGFRLKAASISLRRLL